MEDVKDTIETGREMRPGMVRVWDPFVRFFHWSLVGLFAFAWVTGDEWGKAHELAGYVIAGLVGLRVIWGFVGPAHARFSDFIYSPVVTIRFLADTMRMKASRYIGHNPAGGMMVLGLLMMIPVIAITGFMMTTNAFWGVEWVEDVHKASVNVTLGLIVLHVAGVIFAGIEHKENLVKAMITGWKRK
ncbi:MAG: cytochrome b/b6 domain-containing protein [Nitratireductor sp.]